MADPTLISVFDPQGNVRMIPLDQKAAALAAGGKVAIKMTAPDKSVRWVPSDQYQAALSAGGRPVPFTPDDNAPKGSPVSRFLSSGLEALKSGAKGLIAPFKGAATPGQVVANIGTSMLEGAEDQGRQAVDAAKSGQKSLAAGHALAAVIPGLGPWAAQVGEQVGTQAGKGDYAGAAGTVAGNAALYAAPSGIKAVSPMLREGFRKAGQTTLGLSERAVTDEVAKTAAKANEDALAVKAKNAAADEKTLSERGKVDDKNAALAQKDEAARVETLKKNKDAAEAHKAEREKIEADNREAMRQRDKLTPTKEKLDKASAEMRARVETAREKALKIGNEKYAGVNPELNNIQADPEMFPDAVGAASEALKGSKAEPTLLRAMEKRIETGDPFTYEDLQGDYSSLGNELSKGTLPGDVYHAYDQLHEAIGNEMQRIADSKGLGAQLTDARAYWKRMKQTFGKPLSMSDNATAAVKGANPDFLPEDTQANRLRLLGSFDPEIPKAAEHIGNLRKGLDALPKDTPLRAAVKVPPASPSPEPLPSPTPRAQYGEPNPTTPIEKPVVDPRAIRGNRMTDEAGKIRNYSLKRAAYTSAAVLPGSVVSFIMGHPGMAVAIEAGSVPLGIIGTHLFAKMLEHPGVREFFTKPPAGELERLRALPNADRVTIMEGLRPAVEAAERNGVKVSPALIAAVGASGFPKNHALHRAPAN